MAQPANPSSSDKWSSLLSRLNPIPSFPEYTGPYKVGTADVEIPVSELDSPAPAPDNAVDIETIQFRIFYPAHPEAQGKRITWLPAPQRDHLSAYIQFLGVGQLVAQAVSFLPRHLHYTYIPVVKNAPVLEPNTPNKRWPTVIFSHGLGGSRNAYSQIVGSLASHGVVVICPEHRDGSAVKSFIRIPSQQDRYFVRNTRRVVPYRRIAHDPNDETHALRNDQLRIRLWEMGLVHEALLGIDGGAALTNLNKSTPSLAHFAGQLHVRDPGSIIFAGHSFGSATVVQFLKSVFYAGRPELEAMADPLYVPARDSAIRRQVTPRNVTILLDMWCFPLLAKTTKPLWDLPLPVYASSAGSSSPTSSSSFSSSSSPQPPPPGGNALLAIESEDFHNWTEHLHATARALSPDPSASRVLATAFYDSDSGSGSGCGSGSGVKLAEPHFFFVERSAHLSQSDFGLLFPWLMSRVYGSQEPERALRLNRRALLQLLRANGVPVARTWAADLVDGFGEGKMVGGVAMGGDVGEGGAGAGAGVGAMDGGVDGGVDVDETEGDGRDRGPEDGVRDDRAIFDRSGHGVVDAWRWIDIVGMGDAEAVAAVENVHGKDDIERAVEAGDEAAEVREPEMAGAIEPHATEGATAESH
ncbi:PAF acetylhydrolase [Annulohypoxylon truncatum]|uniref:PAF acetylhydrolase n=1 Tax=Annulohypoxylon truncatum TaxID=327061 RepID=UPI00200854EE|nr:PAF acetylhydrolase [Annulohypoxylon truncatum]KAI1205900.1 PAF acetylhydrolase [Annulohypoxylon truncatum]